MSCYSLQCECGATVTITGDVDERMLICPKCTQRLAGRVKVRYPSDSKGNHKYQFSEKVKSKIDKFKKIIEPKVHYE
jgi:hypothetical protein